MNHFNMLVAQHPPHSRDNIEKTAFERNNVGEIWESFQEKPKKKKELSDTWDF